jgi:excinuclease ABC subunit C
MAVLDDIKAKIATFPRHPGVYVMRDSAGEVIYVGKAKSLRERVRNYFSGQDTRAQIQFLLQRIHDIENIVTGTEHQAFILERDLIAKYKPRYNIRLKDDKSFLSIRIDEDAEWPRLELVRRIEDDGARYYGPFSFNYELRTLLDTIKRTVPLRTCTNTVFYNRQRPCLEYQIKRCAGPCCLPVSTSLYAEWVGQAKAILEGRSAALIQELEKKMEQASAELRFEDAASIRDRITVLKNVKEGQQFVSSSGEDRDVFALYREERLVAVSVLKVRRGRIADNQNFNFSEVLVGDDEVLEATIGQYYESGREIPDEIVVSVELTNASLIADAVCERAGRRVEIVYPQRGVKVRLVGLAELNAREHFTSVFDSETRSAEISKALARLCGLKQAPRRVECIDISNLQGSDIVGALVCFYDGEPLKDKYRKYKLHIGDTPDDFASIYEVVTRRLSRGVAENDLPDLLIIDGGAGQLSKALEARDALGVSIEIVALAKERSAAEAGVHKPERVYLAGQEQPVELPLVSELTHFLKRLRDETHRFVITFHRQRRSKRAVRSVLDEIAGLNPNMRKRLLLHFGSVDKLKGQPEAEIARVGRMPLGLARKVLSRLG